MVHVLTALAIIALGCLLVWFGVLKYNAAAARQVDPKFILSWGLQANKTIDEGIGVALAIAGVVIGCLGVYYMFSG